MTTWAWPFICLWCEHFDDWEPSNPLRCAAFPEGIPEGIINNLIDHRLPVEGDGGLRYEGDLPVAILDRILAENKRYD